MFYCRVSLTALIYFFVIYPLSAFALPADLDTSFNSPNGFSSGDHTNANSAFAKYTAVAVQNDGAIIAIGGYGSLIISKYNADGSLDSDFNLTGTLDANYTNGLFGTDVVSQPDGKFIVLSRVNIGSANSNLSVARFNTDGSLDTTFGPDVFFDDDNDETTPPVIIHKGFYTFDFDDDIGAPDSTTKEDPENSTSLALQADGKILIAGNYGILGNDAGGYSFVMRLNQNGQLDTSFGTNGFRSFKFGLVNGVLRDMALAPNGDIVLVGENWYGYGTAGLDVQSFIKIYDSEGGQTIDADSYDGNLFAGPEAFMAVAVQADYKIVVGGFHGDYSGYQDFVLARFDYVNETDITLDAGFGTDGITTFDAANNGGKDFEKIYNLAIQTDGKIVASGRDNVMRFTTTGILDASFDSNDGSGDGIVASNAFWTEGLAIEPDGNIVFAGLATATTAGSYIARLEGNSFDTSVQTFSFTPNVVAGVTPSTLQYSDIVTLNGFSAPVVPVTITNGEYTLDGGTTYQTDVSYVTNPTDINVRHTSSASDSTATSTILTAGGILPSNSMYSIGGLSVSYTSTTRASADTTPDAFSFTDQTEVGFSQTITSNQITVAGIDAPADLSITNGLYRINGATFSDIATTVSNGDKVEVRHTSATTVSTSVDTVLNIGGITDTFTSTTLAALPDTTPDAFSFIDQTAVNTSEAIISNTITVSGIDSTASISITGGSYSINGASYTMSAGTVSLGDSISVQHTSSASLNASVNTVLTIGGVSDTFTSTTLAVLPDATPDAFSFTDQTDVDGSTLITSNSITVNGINTSSAISVTGGEYSINGAAFSSTASNLSQGDTVRVRHTSSSTENTSVDTVLTIGGLSGTFTSTTLAVFPDTTPDAFNFAEQTDVDPDGYILSSIVTVSGIDPGVPVSISILGGEFSVNGGAFGNTAATIVNGDTVQLRVTASTGAGVSVTTQITIGGVAATFTGTTPELTVSSSGGGAFGINGLLALFSLVLFRRKLFSA